MGIFKKKQYGVISVSHVDNNDTPFVPDGAWVKCNHCGKILYKKTLDENYKMCPNCKYYFRLGAHERVDLICDKNTFIEFNKGLESKNPMKFPGYDSKLKLSKENSKINEAVITGKCKINGMESIICIMDSNFMMGSMGTVVGEKITFAIEKAINEEFPIIIFTASGGARMQEGIFSLMQMAKISAALAKLSEKGLLYITVLTDPTTGGVTASFAMLGDIIIAEPKALIGFAGRRVIEGTIKEKLPDDFQSAEFLLEKGFVDNIVNRDELKNTLSLLLELHKPQGGASVE
ncbi:acetyl-CoA carboxylase, carboxyltransferase subunit beta [uncultured Clostridium sp.]|uniref:acetyl-CoA carboxylase, carboxyltransferase subunit beta n=1 Tax=uncultured Clostridium sp. TaxID=59620 RepID=UPI0025E40673|nr:acetyl-CoA carboxylase, carboxyltransferase subunit beta [uncultured Clostridium sp.]MDU4882292.1 acetyl-CoA carboxylase, carboxyltransferase subunit beta [Clostridium celatum]MDU7075562.1 acetyl-CoA carboxylase, carboxyltransferase subunit beta [Clostridium celatum]